MCTLPPAVDSQRNSLLSDNVTVYAAVVCCRQCYTDIPVPGTGYDQGAGDSRFPHSLPLSALPSERGIVILSSSEESVAEGRPR